METRFGTNFFVAERFFKSAKNAWNRVSSQNRTIAKESFESLEKSTNNISDCFTSFSYIHAILYSFNNVHDATIEFEKSDAPTLHRVLPSLQFCIEELGKIEMGHVIVRDNGLVMPPSIYAMRLSGILKEELKSVGPHDLWLV